MMEASDVLKATKPQKALHICESVYATENRKYMEEAVLLVQHTTACSTSPAVGGWPGQESSSVSL